MFVLGLAPRKIGGLEKFLKYLVVALDAVGWDSVLCFDGLISAEFREYISSPFVLIESIDNQGDLGFACAGKLWNLLRKHKPDTFVYAFSSVMRCFPWLAKIAGCKQIFFNDRSSRSQNQEASPLGFSKRVIGRVLTAPLTAIISNSAFTCRMGEAAGLSSARHLVVLNGVEVREIDPGRRVRFREMYGISMDDMVITQVCWMVEAKGVDTMLRAAEMLLQKHAGVRFLLVGDGPQLPVYKRTAAELGIDSAVVFTGLISNPDETGVFDTTDIYCQPSLWQEASSFAVLEAMSCKLPVIVSNTGGMAENVEEGRSGILVPTKDAESLCAALDQLVTEAELRRSMGAEGYQLILEKHRIEDIAEQYVGILIGGRNGMTKPVAHEQQSREAVQKS
ncbi:MAG: glycosyltransferase family 4 protein [Terracidiphilus sp.]|jgi:glycosyltransferase involved in cell wall biosynthesis